MLDINNAEKQFKEYLKNFDTENEKNRLKIVHTYGVVKASEYIARDLNLSEENIYLVKLIALLHDIGRFKQINFGQSKYFIINFTMPKIMEMKQVERNKVALYLFNILDNKLLVK